jgi:hypothetical protein
MEIETTGSEEKGPRAFVFIVFPIRFWDCAFDLAAHDEWRLFSAGELGELDLAPLDGPALRDWATQKDHR